MIKLSIGFDDKVYQIDSDNWYPLTSLAKLDSYSRRVTLCYVPKEVTEEGMVHQGGKEREVESRGEVQHTQALIMAQRYSSAAHRLCDIQPQQAQAVNVEWPLSCKT
jgi:hypothetical protein